MVFTSSRKKNSRYYWLELGFMALGVILWNPSMITDLLESKGTAVVQNQYPSQSNYAWNTRGYPGQPNAQNPYQLTSYYPSNDSIPHADLQNAAGRLGQYALTAASQWLRPTIGSGVIPSTSLYDPTNS